MILKRYYLYFVLCFVISLGVAPAEAACPSFSGTLRSIFPQQKKFDFEKFKALKADYQKQLSENSKITTLPDGIEDRAALFDAILLKNNSKPSLSIEDLMTNPTRRERRLVVKELQGTFSDKKQTAFKKTVSVEHLYQQNVEGYYPGLFDRITEKTLANQCKRIFEVRLAKQNLTEVLQEMKVIREPNAFNQFAERVTNSLEFRNKIEFPSKYFKLAKDQGFDVAWNRGLKEYLLERYSASFTEELIYEKTLGRFANMANQILMGYGLYQTGEITWEKLKQVMFFRQVDQLNSAQKKITPKALDSIPLKVPHSQQAEFWNDWIETHADAAKDPSCSQYKAAHRQIFGD